jgi:hypothetical protein
MTGVAAALAQDASRAGAATSGSSLSGTTRVARTKLAFSIAALSLWGCLLSAAGCSKQAPVQQQVSPVEAWVGVARVGHAQADEALAQGRPVDAQAALQVALEQPVPLGVDAHDRRAVAQDLLFRMAEISLDRGATEQALDEAARGLEYGRVDDVFTLNLLLASGHAQRALNQHRAAAASFATAHEIERRLLARAPQ